MHTACDCTTIQVCTSDATSGINTEAPCHILPHILSITTTTTHNLLLKLTVLLLRREASTTFSCVHWYPFRHGRLRLVVSAATFLVWPLHQVRDGLR